MPVTESVRSQEFFSFLRPDQVDMLSDAAEIKQYGAGDTVYFQGQAAEFIYVVLEGEVSLRLPGKGGVSLPVDQVEPGTMFGSCLCFDIQAYSTTASCTQDSKLIRIGADVLKELMDKDPRMGYALQRRISHIYFQRYLEAMRKLQAIVLSLPVEAA